MHYRITKIKYNSESLDDLISYLATVESDVQSIDGLQSVTVINISDTEEYSIFCLWEWRSNEQCSGKI